MTVAVTGASGHVGANLVRELVRQGRNVRVMVRNDTRGVDGLDVEKFQGDVTDLESLKKLLHGVDTLFHCAALISIVGSESGSVNTINVSGVRNVVEACLECGVKRLVHFSSIHAFSAYPLDEVIDETRPLSHGKNHFPYDRSKAAGQMEILKGIKKGLNAVIVNPTAVLGPNDFKPSRMGSVLLDLYHGRMPMLVKGGYNWVDARDIVAGAIAAETKGRTGECYLLGGQWTSFRELAEIITRCTGKKTPTFEAPAWTASMAAPFALMWSKVTKKPPKFTPMAVKTIQTHRYISHKKAHDELGYNPRPLEVTIRETLEWFREFGMLDGNTKAAI